MGDFDLHDKGYIHIEYSPNGKHLLCANGDGTISIWNAKTLNKINSFASHAGGVTSAMYNPNGKQILSVGFDGFLRFWDTETMSILFSVQAAPLIFTIASYNHKGDKILISNMFADTVYLLDSSNGKEIWSANIPAGVYSTAFSHNDKLIAVADEDQIFYILDSATGKLIRTIDTEESHLDPPSRLAFSPNGKYLASADDLDLRLWNLETGALIYELNPPGFINFFAFGHNGEYIKMITGQGVYFWKTSTGSMINHPDTEQSFFYDSFNTAAFSPDEKEVALAGRGRILIIDAKTGERINSKSDYSEPYEFTEADIDRLYSGLKNIFGYDEDD